MARTSGSMIQRSTQQTSVEVGRIVNVDMAHWTVDVRTQHTQRMLFNIQVGAPYLHFGSGAGIYAMPEVGSKVQVCLPGDSAAFILCFITTFERENSEVAAGGSQAQTETEEGETEPGSANTEVTFRAGRPKLQQGDIMLRGRDGNQVWLHRGGGVEIKSSGFASSLYLPLLNTIRDVCENYEMLSAGGDLLWTVTRSDESPDGDAYATFTIASRDKAQDAKATVFLRVGHCDDSNRLRLLIAPASIDPRTGEISGDVSFSVEVTDEGDLTVEVKGDVSNHVQGNLDETVDGDRTRTVSGSETISVSSDQSVTISGSHSLEAASSSERFSGSKTIEASRVLLGDSGAVYPVALVTPALVAFLRHTHTVMGSATDVPLVPCLESSISARKVCGT